MLQYLNGIGVSRRSSGGGGGKAQHQQRGNKFKGALKNIQHPQIKPTAKKVAVKQLVQKHSPLNAIRIKKALVEDAKRQILVDNKEPLILEREPDVYNQPEIEAETIDNLTDGLSEVNESENENSYENQNENTTDMKDMGVIYPSFGAFKFLKAKQDQKIAKKESKTNIKNSKATNKTSKATSRQTKADKKGENKGRGKEFFDKGLDLAKNYLNKGEAASKAYDNPPTPASNFFSENKGLIIGGGLGILALFALSKLLPKAKH